MRCLIEWLRNHGVRRGGILDRVVLYFESRSTLPDVAHYAFCATSHCAIARRIVNTNGERKQRTKRNDSRGENRERKGRRKGNEGKGQEMKEDRPGKRGN